MPDDPSLHPDLGARTGELLQAYPDLAAATFSPGSYVENDGTPFSEQDISRAPTHVLRISTTDRTVEDGTVSFEGATLEGAASVPLLVLEDRADAVQDTEGEIAQLLEPYADGAAWAMAIANTADRAASFGVPLAEVQVPAGAPSPAQPVTTAWLGRHFTYDRDGSYYSKWPQGMAAPDRTFPNDVSATYREHATIEHVLDRDRFYALIVATDASGNGTETLVRIADDPAGEVEVDVLYVAARREPTSTHEVCVFHAAAGRGIAVPPSARGTLSPELALLSHEHAVPDMAPVLEGLAIVGGVTDTSTVKVSAIVRPGSFEAGAAPQLPVGVVYLGGDEDDDGGIDRVADEDDEPIGDSQQEHVRYFSAPIDRIVELAAMEDVLTLSAVRTSQLSVDEARASVNHDAYLTNLGLTPGQGGAGVVVGIVDSGIDGTHPAFAGRIEAVWDQMVGDDPAHPPPANLGSGWGQVWDTAADIQANSIDDVGHGTHVAGIAAGAPGGAYTATGFAPDATLVAVRVFRVVINPTTGQPEVAGGDNDGIRRGVQWCFRQAGRRPCVVNLSLGAPGHGHDGVDNFTLSTRRTYRRPNAARDGYDWLAGRVVAAAAGNAGLSRGHTHVDSLAPNATADLPITVATRTTVTGTVVTPQQVDINLFARPLPRGSRGCRVDVRVRLGSGAAQTPWLGFNAAGNVQVPPPLGTVGVGVVNGPPATAPALGLQFTQHQFVRVVLFQAGGIPAGQYVIELRNASSVEIEVHGYHEAAQRARMSHPSFFTNSTIRSMIDSPATAYGIVAVGGTINRASWRPAGAPADGSGDTQNTTTRTDPATNLPAGNDPVAVGDLYPVTCPGPVRGTERTLTAALPGSGVLSARSPTLTAALVRPQDDISAVTVQMSGTSMATPAATGLIACLLAQHPRMSAREVGRRLRDAAGPAPAGWDADLYGAGPTDASQIRIN